MNSIATPAKPFEFPLIRVLALLLIFLGLPIALLWYGIGQWVEERERSQRLWTTQQMESHLSLFKKSESTEEVMQGYFRFFEKKIPRMEHPRQKFLEVVDVLDKRFPHTISRLVINERGEVLEAPRDLSASPELIKSFFADYSALCRSKEDVDPQAFAKYRCLIGPLIGRGVRGINLESTLIQSSYRREQAFTYFSSVFTDGMVMVFFDRNEDWDDLGLKNCFLEMQGSQQGGILDLISLKNPGSGSASLWGPLLEERLPALAKLEGSTQPFLFHAGYIWTELLVNTEYRIIMAVPDPSQVALQRLNRLLTVCLLLFLIVAVWVTRPYFRGQKPLYLSLRVKLGLLFFYVAGMPILLMAISAHGYLRERREVLEAEMHLRQETIIREFDRRFLEANGRLEMEMRSILESPFAEDGNFAQTVLDRLQAIQGRFKPAIGELFDEKGTNRFHLNTRWSSVASRVLALIQGSVTGLLRDINQTQGIEKVSAKEQLISLTAEFLGINVDLIFAMFTESLGSLREFSVAKGALQMMMHPIRDRNGKAQVVAILGWPKEDLEATYARNSLGSFTSHLGEAQLFVATSRQGESYPLSYPFASELLPLKVRIEQQALPVRHRFLHQGETYFVTGLQGTNLSNSKIFAISPEREIDQELVRYRQNSFILGGCIFLLSLLAGRALARAFLLPVDHLGAGLEAMQKREFAHRVPVTNHDELGVLTGTFNSLLESLEDLEVAKIVQETFFPQSSLVQNDWEIFGTCLSASRVGGDYFDYFAVGEHRLAIILGDVSGHGVSAALVVAMAKALVAHPANDYDPEHMLAIMQQVFFKHLGRKKMMTCLFGVLDTQTGDLTIANAGHNYPYLIRNGTLQTLAAKGMPLGVKIRRTGDALKIRLQPEDVFIGYTDGFVEALNNAGEQIGYPKVEGELPGLLRDSAQATEQSLRKWHQTIARPGSLDDDITLVVLQQNSRKKTISLS